MKKNLLIVISMVLATALCAQNQKKSQKSSQSEGVTKIVTVTEDGERTEVIIPGVKVEVTDFNDTVAKVTIGRRRFEIIGDHNRSRVRMVRLPIDKFKGHWAGVEIGFNGYLSSDHTTSLPANAYFMNPNRGKSVALGINFLQYSIPLQYNKNNLGLVLGSGLTWYNYRTDAPYLFEKETVSGETIGVPTPAEWDLTKNKITSVFINFPLLLEWQLPASNDAQRFFISAGPYAGFRLWGHTKVVYNEGGSRQKERSRKDININPLQYGVMVRFGYRFIKLYGTYNFSTLYSTNMGPELYPYTIGISLLSF